MKEKGEVKETLKSRGKPESSGIWRGKEAGKEGASVSMSRRFQKKKKIMHVQKGIYAGQSCPGL